MDRKARSIAKAIKTAKKYQAGTPLPITYETIVLPKVNMTEFYEWLNDRLPLRVIQRIKRVNNREGFLKYIDEMKIEFAIELEQARSDQG